MCGTVFDTQRGNWRIKFTNELIEETGVAWIKTILKAKELNGMTIQYAKRNTERIKATIIWNPIGKRPRDRPKKRWKGKN